MTQDMRTVIQPKSDQLNADDFVGGPRTVRITGVEIRSGEQPISVHFEGDNGKPWKPCKTTARLMVAAWGPDASQYKGRSLTLYRDPTVKWAGLEVGGIRISHMSHIDNDMIYAATVTKGKRAPIKVKPLKADVAPLKVVTPEPDAPTQPDAFDVLAFASEVANYLSTAIDADELAAWWKEQEPTRKKAGAADRNAAIEIANTVKTKIAALRGEGEV